MRVPVRGSIELLERDVERGSIDALLERAAAGSGALLAVEAGPGLGKTALLASAREAAAESGMATAAARGSDIEQNFAFGVVRQLFEPQLLAATPRERRELFTGAAVLAQPLLTGGWAAPGDGGADRALPLLHGLYWLLVNLTEERPLLLALDDLHWADDASLRFLLFLVPRLESLPVCVAVATRPEDGEAAGGSLSRLLSDPLVEVVSLAPLSEAGVVSTLRAALGEPGPAFARACYRATGGNPFFVHELARELIDRGIAPADERADDVPSVGPRSVARLVRRRLDRLPRAATSLARAVAVLGDDAEVRHAARLARMDAGRAAELAGLLVGAAILADERPLRFRHPLVRSAIYAELRRPERAAAHGSAARLLAAERAIDAAAAHHLSSERIGDPEAVELLLRAAQRATARGAPAATVRLLARALEEPPPNSRRVEILAALGRAELALAQHAQAEAHLREALASAGDLRTRVDVTVALSRAVGGGRSVDEATTLLEHERRRLAASDRDLALELEAEFAWLGWLNVANAPTAARIERYARLPGRTATERKLLASVAHLWAMSGRPAADCLPLAKNALAHGRLLGDEGVSGAHWMVAFAVLRAGEDAQAADDALAEALVDVRRHVAPDEFCLVTQHAASWGWYRGDVAGAEASARLALEVQREHGLRFPGPTTQLVRVLVETGRLAEAEDALREEGLDGALDDSWPAHGVRLARAALRLAQGRYDDAIADLEEVRGYWAALGAAKSLLPGPCRSMLALALGDRERARARALAREELRLARRWGAPGATGVALSAMGLVEGGQRGLRLLHEAAATLATSERRLEHARALVELGGALRRMGQRREARETLREGADLAHRCGADALVARARSELTASGARPRNIVLTGVESLTPMERRITDLAAQGLKNAEVAQALFVTVKNVEMHLSRAYRKLDISSRAELPRVLLRAGG